MTTIFTVSELTARVKRNLEQEFPSVWVQGQVSNFSRPSSGHVYFTLKDEQAALNVVWFRGSQVRAESFDPLTGEVFEVGAAGTGGAYGLADGKEVLCGGRLTVYPPRGVYQLVAEMVQDVGLGRLYMEFEALKRRFAAKGYFDRERKRPVPRNPGRVALIAAPGSAALRDFLRLAGERGHGGEIRVYPTLVQGEQAPEQIAKALDLANEQAWAEVAVLIRGGGSLEDLWAYNTEPVAEAVYRSRLPVVAGVGHEVDVSIADMVADLRAATPSHAAQLLYEERETLIQALDGREIALDKAWSRILQGAWARLEHLQRALVWLSPAGRMQRASERLGDLARRLETGWAWKVRGGETRLRELHDRLGRLFGPEKLAAREGELETLQGRLFKASLRTMERREAGLDRLHLKLDALDPEGPLRRGYSVVRLRATGSCLHSVREARPGDELDIHVQDGTVGAVVEKGGSETG